MLINGIKNSLICMGVILLSISFVDGVTENQWMSLQFQLGILLVGVLFSIWQFILAYFELKNFLIEIIINFVVTLLLTLVIGKWFGWYDSFSNVGYVCIEVFIVFLICYVLGVVRNHKEVDKINEVLKKRK